MLSLGACTVYDSGTTFKHSAGGSKGSGGGAIGDATPDVPSETGGVDGTGGSGGADAEPDVAAKPDGIVDAGPYDLIDDMEHDGTACPQAHGRNGHWVSAHPQTDGGVMGPTPFTMVAIDLPRTSLFSATDAKAVHIWGSGFDTIGAGVSVGMIDTPASKSYDVSMYTGVVFWARVGDPAATTSWLFKVSDVNTDPAGGVCSQAGKWCFDDHAAYRDVGATWQRYDVTFDELAQGGWGNPQVPSVDKTKIYSLRWQLLTPTDTFDLWIDDVAFY
jgi:hypothetical protein